VASAGSSTAPAVRHGVAPLRAGQGTSFVLRRLHSLTGIIPVGAFLLEHILISNATAIGGPETYGRQVSFLVVFHWYFFLSCSVSGCLSPFTRSMAFTSGTGATATRSPIRGPATGCTPRSDGRGALPSLTSFGIRGPCALRGSTFTHIRMLRSARCRVKFCRLRCSCSMLRA